MSLKDFPTKIKDSMKTKEEIIIIISTTKTILDKILKIKRIIPMDLGQKDQTISSINPKWIKERVLLEIILKVHFKIKIIIKDIWIDHMEIKTIMREDFKIEVVNNLQIEMAQISICRRKNRDASIAKREGTMRENARSLKMQTTEEWEADQLAIDSLTLNRIVTIITIDLTFKIGSKTNE